MLSYIIKSYFCFLYLITHEKCKKCNIFNCNKYQTGHLYYISYKCLLYNNIHTVMTICTIMTILLIHATNIN